MYIPTIINAKIPEKTKHIRLLYNMKSLHTIQEPSSITTKYLLQYSVSQCIENNAIIKWYQQARLLDTHHTNYNKYK